MAGGLFFGFIEALQLTLQALNVNLPHQLLLALPYILTIIAVSAAAGRSREPFTWASPTNVNNSLIYGKEVPI